VESPPRSKDRRRAPPLPPTRGGGAGLCLRTHRPSAATSGAAPSRPVGRTAGQLRRTGGRPGWPPGLRFCCLGAPACSPSRRGAAAVTCRPRADRAAYVWWWSFPLGLGETALLEGDLGLGKSLAALDVCARLRTGRPHPTPAPASARQPSWASAGRGPEVRGPGPA
jgi:hypothetical protein